MLFMPSFLSPRHLYRTSMLSRLPSFLYSPSIMAEPEPEPRASLLTIPPELREIIYKLILHPDANRIDHGDEYASYHYPPALVLFQINRQIYHESRKVFRDLNILIRIQTPWPEAPRHVQSEGHCPILLSPGPKADAFTSHSLNVAIEPAQQALGATWDTYSFIILLEDLPAFTRSWFYSNLSHPELNRHLRLYLELRAPFKPDWEEQTMTKTLQQKLLLPFGEVKGLHNTMMKGDLKPLWSVEQEMRRVQFIPQDSPEHCLREATRFKFEGNAALKAGDCPAALKLYGESWLAMHVVIKGRERHIHGDGFFRKQLREEPYVGKNGDRERLLLRVQLVANTCAVYLKMKEWEQCRHWGMRSIMMVRQGFGVDGREEIPPEDEAMRGFDGADSMGKIYFRTAVAYKELGDESEARKLLRVARVYLPNDQLVQKEIAATALRI